MGSGFNLKAVVLYMRISSTLFKKTVYSEREVFERRF